MDHAETLTVIAELALGLAGFSAIVIAFIARFRPLQVILAGFALAGVYTAGETLKVFYSVSEAVVILIEGAILLSLLISQFFSTYKIQWAGRPVAE